ncbi:MAG: YfhO family protein [Eubacteriales bacterium]|nr:YfhO family protein [Eubacteriales bacterium]
MGFAIFGGKKKNPLIKKKTDTNVYIILAFMIPFVLMFLLYGLENFSGFNKIIPDFVHDLLRKLGFSIREDEQQILVIDMWHQYFPFFRQMNETLKEGGSLLYQWENGLGTSFLPVIAYYCSSPLNILSLLFPSDFLVEGMALLVITKIALSSTFMFIYLKKTFSRNDSATLLFAFMYGFCAFNMGYSWCTMWLDVVMLLPLCILGFDRLLSEGKFLLYSVTLGLIMYSNYYIGFMVCVFLVCYYPVRYFSNPEKRGTKKFFSTTAEVIAFSALGCGLAAFMLIPTFLSMQNNSYMNKGFSAALTTYQTFIRSIGNLMPGVDVTYRNGLPNIYCGFLTAILGATFFVNKKIPTREKVLNGALLGFLLISFNWNILNFVWHGFHFPNELPYRFSFLFSFVLITIAFRSFNLIKGVSKKKLAGVAVGIFAFLLLLEAIEKDTFSYATIYIGIGLLIIYTLALYAYKKGKLRKWGSQLVIVIVAVCEVTAVSFHSLAQVGSSSKKSYYSTYNDVQTLLKTAEANSSDFYRVEVSRNWTVNDPALYCYNGVSEFSSVINSHLTDFTRSLGLNSEKGANSLVYCHSSPVINSLFNIKYLIGNGYTVADDSHLTLAAQSGNSSLYENKYPLSLGFMVKDSIYEYTTDETSVRTEAQENLINYATGLNVKLFDEIESPEISSTNTTSTYRGAGSIVNSAPTNTKQSASVSLTYVSDKDQDIYFGISTTNLSGISVTVGEDGEKISYPSQGKAAILSAGRASAGDKIRIDVTFSPGKIGDIKARVYGFNDSAWEKAYAQLSKNMITVTDYTDRKVTGTVKADEDGVLLTSIPYDKGWSVKVDGKEVAVKPLCNALCAVPLSAGEHTVEFSFFTYGLTAGIIVSIACAGLLVLIFIMSKKKPDSRKTDGGEDEKQALYEAEENVSDDTNGEDTDVSETEEYTESVSEEDKAESKTDGEPNEVGEDEKISETEDGEDGHAE